MTKRSTDSAPGDEAPAAPQPSSRSQRGLDWLNFFIADVETGFGPFVSLYLATLGWGQGQIGLALMVGGIAGIVSQLPGGALVDAVPAKRLLIGIALGLIAVGALIFAFLPSRPMVFLAEVLQGGTAGIITPALAAIGLALVGHGALSRRLGRNQRFDSLGNAATAALIGAVGHLVSLAATFVFVAGLCVPAAFALKRIRGDEIDYARARSARDTTKPREAARQRDLLKNRPLMIFVASLVLFQFADASMLPLASERLGQEHRHASELITSGLVVMPQIVTALIAGWIARRADTWGRKPLLVAGFAVLPVRALLFAFAPAPWYLVGIQTLGGLTSAIVGIMTPLVIADVTEGSGRYNLAQGAAGTAIGIGAAISTGATGYLVELFGYTAGFLVLLGVAVAGLALIAGLLPETKSRAAATT